jgi:hypothetical protein
VARRSLKLSGLVKKLNSIKTAHTTPYIWVSFIRYTACASPHSLSLLHLRTYITHLQTLIRQSHSYRASIEQSVIYKTVQTRPLHDYIYSIDISSNTTNHQPPDISPILPVHHSAHIPATPGIPRAYTRLSPHSLSTQGCAVSHR